MKCKRLNEVLELLQFYWSKDSDLSLMEILQKLPMNQVSKPLNELTDEVIIYQLKMDGTDKYEPIPGLKKITKKILKPHCSVLAVSLNKRKEMKKVLLALGLGVSTLMSVNSFAADLQEGKQYVQVSQQASQQKK